MKVLLVDHYDSFVFNLWQAVGRITGHQAEVVRHDDVDADWVARFRPSHVVLSPGPGDPTDARWFRLGTELVRHLPDTPILGVCLGHQGIAAALGATVQPVPPCFGHTSEVHHDQQGLFAGLPTPLTAMRYHALAVHPDSLPPELLPTARTDDGLLMGFRHRQRPLFGLQFHPESYATEHGDDLLQRFLSLPASR
jgi:anthranilate synthase/aminodeoxychorismate synthase-like glutamine amidotransferase